VSVTPTVWVRPRQGPNLADLVSQPGTTSASGDSDPIDVLGSAYAATDGDPRTSWTAPQRVVQYHTPPNLTLKLPAPAEVAALRVTPSTSTLPAHPKLVAVDLGDGPQVRPMTGYGGAQTIDLRPHTTDTIKVSLLDWDDVIDRTALGFDQLKPPGLGEIAALDRQGRPIAAADAARNRARVVALPCGRGPIVAVAGQFVQTSIDTTVGALLDGDPIPAKPCQAGPIALPAGQQELIISPGAAFVVDGVQLVGPLGRELITAPTDPVKIGTWRSDHREVDVPASQAPRILVVPESINPGWTARTRDGTRLTPVTVNGWQQGWVVPPGTSGTVTLHFGSNAVYRAGIAGGLALLPILLLLALVPARRPPRPADPARPWQPGTVATSVAVVAVGAVVSGVAGVIVVGAALGVRYVLRNRTGLLDGITVGVSAGGLILAGTVLSQNPWRSVDGYAGHSPSVQLLALISVGALAASICPTIGSPPDRRPD
jgi:arabinofuranan 3-O-arabinosyltransferase